MSKNNGFVSIRSQQQQTAPPTAVLGEWAADFSTQGQDTSLLKRINS